ncbi:MAG: hypothetical protein KKC03_14030 [Bacteroidetes bacterium]|nr:hypothetical protein [Bacteroidota bacterium]
MKGIEKKEIMYVTPKGATIKVLSSWRDKVEVEVMVPSEGGSPKGAKGNMLLSTLPGLAEQIRAAEEKKEKDFAARYPGIDDLLDIIRLHGDADRAFEKMMETGDSVLRDNRPAISINDALAKYPIAAAYLHIYNMSEADPSSQIGFIRRSEAEKAFAQIEGNTDVIQASIDMDAAIEAASNTPAYRNNVAEL